MDQNTITSLLDGSATTDSSSLTSSILPEGFAGLFTAFMIITIVMTLVITVLYILNMITTYRAHKATIETRNILREMNERDKARSFTGDHQSETYASASKTSSVEATASSSSVTS